MMLALTVENLEVRAPDGRVLLTCGHFTAGPGEVIGLKGPSGAGKSTFLHALAGLQARVTGRIDWNGRDLARLGDGERARFRRENVGLIFQDFLLFEELSALENAALATAFNTPDRRKAIRRSAESFLGKLGVPSGKRTVDSFSGGERQRTAIARALAHDPAVILADEPTASLDRATADALIADLIALARAGNRTFIAVSHDLHLLERMDRVIEVTDGRLGMEASPFA